jgi:mycobactin salicyl-AMP ligase
MNAVAAKPNEAPQEETDNIGWGAMRLSSLLAATAERHPERIALIDQVGRQDWSGRPRIDWSHHFARHIVNKLAHFLAGLGLKAGSTIGLCLPNGSEACLSLFAIEQAGFIPCLLPLGMSEKNLSRAVEAAHIQAVITQSVIDNERPAYMFCRIAAGYFGLRFICAFGPMVPDGVVDLDQIIASENNAAPPMAAPLAHDDAGIITFSRLSKTIKPVFRPCQSLVAATVNYLIAARISPGDRILTLLPPDDLLGLTTGLVASILSGATLECHGLFNSKVFLASLDRGERTHLVVPGWMEPALAKIPLPPHIISVVLAHRAPIKFKAKSLLRNATIDVLSFDELAIIARPRDAQGRFALSLEDNFGKENITTRNLLRVRREEDGAVSVSGLAASIRDYKRSHEATPPAPHTQWIRSGFVADVFANILIAVRAAKPISPDAET